jgi:predicted ABC-type ATPase
MFAGPNGSGKSTLKSCLPTALIGIYLNPDELEAEIRQQGFLDLTACGVETTAAELLAFFQTSKFLISAG